MFFNLVAQETLFQSFLKNQKKIVVYGKNKTVSKYVIVAELPV